MPLALLLTGLLCSNAQAEFFIDNFSILDQVGGGPTAIGSNGITVAVSDNTGTTTATLSDSNRYSFIANNIGDEFVVSYDWAGVFGDLQSISGLQLTQSPLNFFGDWTVSINTGVGASVELDPAASTILASPIALDNATELTYTFTYDGGSPLAFGIGSLGGTANALFATPEPTAFLMLGTAGLIVLSRRRRRN